MNPKRTFFLSLAAALGLGLGYLGWQATTTEPPQVRSATVLPAPLAIPDFALVDQDGASVDRRFFEGQWDLVFFGFTHCPDVCPTTLQTLALAQRQLVQAEFESAPRIVLVSVDPQRDTPAKLRKYIDYFGGQIAGLTGTEPALREFTDGLGIFFQREETAEENYNVDHSAVVLLLNPAGEFSALFSAPHRPESFVNDLQAIIKQ